MNTVDMFHLPRTTKSLPVYRRVFLFEGTDPSMMSFDGVRKDIPVRSQERTEV